MLENAQNANGLSSEGEQFQDVLASLKVGSAVSAYSLQDPWEWHSEVVAAYVLKSIENHINNKFSGTHDAATAEEYRVISERLANRLHRTVFSLYYLANIDNGQTEVLSTYDYRLISDELVEFLASADQLPISDSSLDYLTCRYVVKNTQEVFNVNQLNEAARLNDIPLESAEIQQLQDDLVTYWGDVCSQY